VKRYRYLWSRQRSRRLFVFIQLVTDVDLLLPLLKSAKSREDLVPLVCISDKVSDQLGEFLSTLASLNVEFQIIPRRQIVSGKRPSLRNIAALVSASESTANPHRAAHVLAKRANTAGIKTYTLQHGFDNIGLTYFDHIHDVENIRFASQKIFTWCPMERLHPEIPLETRRKCLPLGCTKDRMQNVDDPGGLKDHGFLIAVFENLHWHRYDENYRRQFLLDLNQTAERFTDATMVIKPHPAGKWLTEHFKGPLPNGSNIIIADPRNPKWRPYTGPVLVAMADAIITTPSTVAFDAARLGRPVAVVGYRLDVKDYEPLPIIRSVTDWATFLSQIRVGEARRHIEERVSSFVAQVLVPGDACSRILSEIAAEIVQ
jgi:hypothetical protein